MNTSYHIISGNNQQHYCIEAGGPKKKPKVKWSVKVEAVSPPLVHENALYISGDEVFYAFDKNTSKILWTLEIPGKGTPPAIIGDKLLIGGNHIDNYLYVVDKNTGKLLNKYRTGTSMAGVHKSPLVEDDKIIFAAGKTVHALSLDSLKPVWKYKMTDRASSFPVTAGDGLVFAISLKNSWKGKLYGVDTQEGKEAFKLPLESMTSSNMVYKNGYLYFTDLASHLNILHVTSGERQRFPVVEGGKSETFSYLALKKENLLIVIGAMAASLNLSNGQWSWIHHAKGSIGQPVIADEVVYFATCFDGVKGLDFQSGNELFHIHTDTRSLYPCAVDGGSLYLAGSMNEHELIAFA